MKFFPPELVSEEADGAVENLSETDWEQALHYHDLKKQRLERSLRDQARASAIRGILRKARATMGSVTKPYELKNVSWDLEPSGELDLEGSLEENPALNALLVEKKEIRRAELVLCLDTSLSMTGKKLAINAVALAVIALQIEPADLAIIAFESEATVIKPLGKEMTIQSILEKFLDVPARGLTNIEAGLLAAEKECKKGRLKKRAVILMSDGRHTAGANPETMVKRLPRMHMVQTGSPWSSPRFCRSLAQIGRGKYIRVSQIEQLPKALYSLVHEIIR